MFALCSHPEVTDPGRSLLAMRMGPTGPEDPTPGAEVGLTSDQYAELVAFVPRKHHSIRLRDRGAAYVEAELLGPEGEVTARRLLFPLSTKRSPASWRWYLRHGRALERAAEIAVEQVHIHRERERR
jgi:hypothetical protein